MKQQILEARIREQRDLLDECKQRLVDALHLMDKYEVPYTSSKGRIINLLMKIRSKE